MTDRVSAKDEIFKVFLDAWASETPAVTTYVPQVRYKGVVYPSNLPVDKYWARLSLQVVDEDQTTLRNGTRRFETNGLIFVQLFCPINDSKVANISDKLAELARNVFRHKTPPDNVLFTRARINDNIDPESDWLRVNVISDYQYTQFIGV